MASTTTLFLNCFQVTSYANGYQNLSTYHKDGCRDFNLNTIGLLPQLQ